MASISAILMKISSELKAPKSQYNSFGKCKYRSCEGILEAVKPLLSKHGGRVFPVMKNKYFWRKRK